MNLRPVAFADNGLSLCWRLRMSLHDLEQQDASNIADSNTLNETRVAPSGRCLPGGRVSRAGVSNPCAYPADTNPLFHSHGSYAVTEA